MPPHSRDLELRFAQYEGYPSGLRMLSRKFNPSGWLSEGLAFIQAPSHRLDVGLSLPLQKLALGVGLEAEWARFLSSEGAHEAIEPLRRSLWRGGAEAISDQAFC